MNLFLANVEEAEMGKVPKSVVASSEWMRGDLSNAANIEEMADRAYQSFGAVDLLCNNAGVVPGGRHRQCGSMSRDPSSPGCLLRNGQPIF
ncbi:SDR family oxidoreductase [Sphingomonas sp. C8-2]|jgi:NADP-dependent 3-hydroxy acid dehydrogenase YdfG|nr:SDR family oxidoreductase [Sphingomonas sp. C8-2]